MKDSSRHVLGYFAAFTLGLICMAVIVQVARRESSSARDHVESTAVPEEGTAAPTPPSSLTKREFGMPPARSSAPSQKEQNNASAERMIAEEPPERARQPEITPVAAPLPAVFSSVRVIDVQAQPAFAPQAATRVSGRIFLRGEPPPERSIPLDPVCAKENPAGLKTRFYQVGKDRGLADVVVQIAAGLPDQPWPVPHQPHIIVQKGCLFQPYVSAVQTGQRILLRNMDDRPHAISVNYAGGEIRRTLFRRGETDYTFSAPEQFVRLKCEVHPWDFAYVTVVRHPFFAVTDRNGVFIIGNLPPGRYTLEAVHRKAGVIRQEIELLEHRETTVELVFDLFPGQPSAS